MQRLRQFFGRGKASEDIQTPGWLRAGLPYSANLPGYRLPDAQAELYQRLSWVNIAVNITSQTASGTQFQVMQLQGEKKNAIENHPFELLLRRPNPLQSRFEFLEALVGFQRLTGNAYIWLNRTSKDAPPAEMWIIPSQQIEPIPDEQMYLRGYMYDPGNGATIPLETWEICHWRRFHPRNRFVGLSAIEALATVATGDMAMSEWNTNFFHKDHAKPAGALAYADPISDPIWESMKEEIKEQFGGTERKMMMMRNAGKGGVSWIPFGIPQKDMEFLQARTFNKEEIFAALAPGLSSMLAVNATEANSVTGKAIFSEMTIWPIHTSLAEKFTNDILPAYGENLVGEFDDVRASDRVMKLQEQQAASKVMTVKEIRERYYGLDPLGDERDDQLVEGAQSAPPSDEPEPEPQPMPPQLQQALINKEVASPAPPDPPSIETEPDALKADLMAWQRKAIKRMKAEKGAACKFESDEIPDTLNASIVGALETVTERADIYRIFDDALAWGVYP